MSMLTPSIKMSPDATGTKPVSALKSVVLPEPFGPRRRCLPSNTTLTPLRTGSLLQPYLTTKPLTSIRENAPP
ncbi:MAG: hypothetical protein QW701_04430 [Candidatus Nezhaarchaeales archaeon]